MEPLNSLYTPEENFAGSLRLVPNRELGKKEEIPANILTVLKKRGLSGWVDQALPITCATGTVIREPARSTDGFATIDLQLEEVQVGNRLFILDGAHGIAHTRFLRVEYLHHGKPIPHANNRVRICGKARWDTDYEGWYEIHPRNSSDVSVL